MSDFAEKDGEICNVQNDKGSAKMVHSKEEK